MTGFGLLLHNLRHFWRSHLGVVLGAACSTAVLVGALAVGDSVGSEKFKLFLLFVLFGRFFKIKLICYFFHDFK